MNIPDLFTPSLETARVAATLAVNILVQSSLIIIAGLLATRLLRRRGAAVQSTVLRVTLVAVVACPFASWVLASAGVSGFAVQLPRAPVATLTSDPEMAEVSVADGTEMNEADGRFTHDESTASLRTSATSPLKSHEFSDPYGRSIQAADVAQTPDPDATESTLEILPPQEEPNGRRIASLPLIAWMYGAAGLTWSLIALLLLARLFVANLLVWRGRARAETADPRAISACERLARAIGVPTPATRISSHIQSPCLVGVVRPTILLPITMKSVSRDVLVHELAHLRRQDCLWQLLSCLTSAALWFQPLSWLLGRRLEQAADDVADDFVVQFGSDRADYARQLVDIAERYQLEWSTACVGAGIVSFKSSLAKRVVRILDTSRSLSTRTGLAALAAIVSLGATCTLAVGLLGAGTIQAKAAAADDNTNAPQQEKQEATTTNEASAERADDVVCTGRVLDPNGDPVTGAKVYIAYYSKEPVKP